MDNPNAPATPRQLWALFCATKRDHRGMNLTKQQASDLLQEHNAKRGIVGNVADKVDFAALMQRANEAAQIASDKWIAEHTRPIWNVMQGDRVVDQMLDVCGFSYVEVTDKRTAFAKWLKTAQNGYNGAIHARTRNSNRQEMGLNEAEATAILEVLTDAGIRGLRFYSRID